MYFINTELDDNKTVFSSLTNVFGINFKISKKICKNLGFSEYIIFGHENQG